MSINITPIGVTPAAGIGPQSSAPASSAVSAVTGAIATRIATGVTGQLGFAPRQTPLAHDLFGVRDAANALSAAVQASPGQSGEIERALTQFVQAAAARIGAQPHSASVQALLETASGIAGGTSDDLVASLINAARQIQ